MGLISILDLVSFIALIAAFILLLKGWKRIFSFDAKLLFAGFLVLQLICSVGNFLAWANITDIVDRYVEYMAILIPVLWISFFYAFLRRRTEEALREGAEKYRRMEANIPGMVYIYVLHSDGSHSFPYVTEESRELFGLEPEDIMRDGTLLSDLIHPDDRERRDESIRISAETLQPWRQELRHIVNGRLRWYDCMSRPERQPNGDVLWDGIILEITDRKFAEETLRDSECFLQDIFDGIKDGISILDRDLNIIRVNKWMEERYACELPLVGKKCYEVFHENHSICTDCPSVKALQKGDVHVSNVPFDSPENGGGMIELTAFPLKDINGSVIGVIEHIKDITDRVRIQEELKASEIEKTTILESMSELIVYRNRNMETVWASKSVADWHGITPQEVRGRVCYKARYGREEPCENCYVVEAMMSGERRELETESPDGKYWHVTVNPVTDASGKVVGTIEVSHDITERRKAVDALSESEEKFRIIFEQANDAITYLGVTGKILDVNKKTMEIFGGTKEELVGKHFTKIGILNIKDIPKFLSIFRKMILGKHVPTALWISNRKGKKFYLECLGTLVKGADGSRALVVVARDCTERKITEQRLLDYQSQLKSLASQLSVTEERERRRLASELHDHIGQSLIISKIKLDAVRHSGTSNEIPEVLDEVTMYLGRVIQDVRTLTFDLSSPILYELGFEAAVSEWLSDHIQNKYDIETEFEDDEKNKPLDNDIRALMFRNVRELLINVVKHAEAKRVKVTTNKVGNHIEVSVEDNGVGFDPGKVISMATRKSKFGLFSIRERLEKLGGNIEIKSIPGKGSKITMTAPLKLDN